ncbi:TetR/AcrR family transcriptional regulator [Virgibacillus siamensis]|uniref:TetR/AcrR family transcriptional regulator n=1 Tax=Virgibacillus siamensis TaxID=480071 RepID=UPI00098472E2|nr:TetR/AcrR family transcriptional regulator [Virgibacillus siamensis]
MDRKEEIMQSAIRFFSEKGYFSTSVQEIADDCKISKGTLYQFFDSKEELLIQAIESNHKKMLQSAANVNVDASLSAKEKLIRKIAAQADGFRNNKDFMVMLLRALPPHDNPEIALLMKRIKVTMTNWYKDCLLEAYGEKAEPYIWDFTIMFQGMLREYISLVIHDKKDIDVQRVARFVVERIDTMIGHTTDLVPVLTASEMKEYMECEDGMESDTSVEELDNLLEELKGKAKRLPIPDKGREECLSAIQSLHNECHEQEPRSFFIKAMLLYLAENTELKGLLRRIGATLNVDITAKP